MYIMQTSTNMFEFYIIMFHLNRYKIKNLMNICHYLTVLLDTYGHGILL